MLICSVAVVRVDVAARGLLTDALLRRVLTALPERT